MSRLRCGEPIAVAIAAACAVAVSVALSRRRASKRIAELRDPSSRQSHSHEDLRNHTKVFEKQVIRVAPDVLCAIGYGLANCICIRGTTGLVIIDTLESSDAAEECLSAFRSSESFEHLPIKGIIYTHFHTDHVQGSEVFLREASPDCVVWAHHSTEGLTRQFNVMLPIAFVRGARQFGMHLQRPLLENCGIGPVLRWPLNKKPVLPNRVYGDSSGDFSSGDGEGYARRDINVAGVNLRLVHAPGETDDQTVVYMPSRRILFAADNFYEAFPNIYAIRGVPYRNPIEWAKSLDAMRSLNAEVMVPSHTLPIYGKEDVAKRLRNYRDAIAFVHDQTVRLALKGCHPNSIANDIRLPSALRNLEYLKEFYGTVHWSSKSIFDGYLGWFSGDPAELFQLSPTERAQRMVKLGGGHERCLSVAEDSFQSGDLQWALEVLSAVLQLSDLLPRSVRDRARKLRSKILRTLGEQQVCANARNYYLTCALEDEGAVEGSIPKSLFKQSILTKPMEDLFDAMKYRVDAKAAEGQCRSLRVSFSDTGNSFLLLLRNSVVTCVPCVNELATSEICYDHDASAISTEVSCTEKFWRQLLLSSEMKLLAGNLSVTKGTLAEFGAFMRCFDGRS